MFLSAFWDNPIQAISPKLVGVDNSDRKLLYGGKSHSIFAPSGLGKTFVALQMALQVIRETQRPVLFLDCESSLDVILTRFRQLGGEKVDGSRFAYWRLNDPIPLVAAELRAFVLSCRMGLVVLDGVTQSCAAQSIDADKDNAGYTRWYQQLQHAVSAEGDPADPALLLLDHFSEKTSKDSSMYSRGATAKRDTVTATAWRLKGENFAQGQAAKLQLLIAKSRNGDMMGAVAADVIVAPSGDEAGTLSIRFVAPTSAAVVDPLVDVKRAIAELLAGQAMSKRSIEPAVEGDDKRVRTALDWLCREGIVAEATDQPKQGGYHPLTLVKPYDGIEPEGLQATG